MLPRMIRWHITHQRYQLLLYVCPNGTIPEKPCVRTILPSHIPKISWSLPVLISILSCNSLMGPYRLTSGWHGGCTFAIRYIYYLNYLHLTSSKYLPTSVARASVAYLQIFLYGTSSCSTIYLEIPFFIFRHIHTLLSSCVCVPN